MIKENLQHQIQEAMKAGDQIRVSTLKLLSSALHNEEIAKQRNLTDEEEIQVVRRQLKQRDEAAEAYGKGGRVELANKEKQEAEILKEFLPQQMSEEELSIIVEQVIAETGGGDFGRVMGAIMKEVGGKADGGVVSEIVKQKLKV